MSAKYFIYVLIALDLAAAAFYAMAGEWPRAGYWFSAGCISAFTLWM